MKLSIQIEFDKVLEIETTKTSVIVGRSPHSHLPVDHNSISRKHCKIEQEKDCFYITDLESTNGVFINGERIPPHKRTPFDPAHSQLALGTLPSSISIEGNKGIEDTSPQNIISATTHPDGIYTATIRLGRLDIKEELSKLNRRGTSLRLDQKEKNSNTPYLRNPVSGTSLTEDDKDTNFLKGPYLLVLVAVLGIVWLILDHLDVS